MELRCLRNFIQARHNSIVRNAEVCARITKSYLSEPLSILYPLDKCVKCATGIFLIPALLSILFLRQQPADQPIAVGSC